MTVGRLFSILAIPLLIAGCSAFGSDSASRYEEPASDAENLTLFDGPPPVPATANAAAPKAEDADAETRKLMADSESARARCRSARRDDAQIAKICNEPVLLQRRLAAKGWCWDIGPPAGQERWVRCADDPDYVEGMYDTLQYRTE